VTHSVSARLRRLPRLATEIAEGVAVLSAAATVPRITRLTSAEPGDVAEQVALLVEGELLRERRPALEFTHPLVRECVNGAMPAPRRAADHARAAALLCEEGRARMVWPSSCCGRRRRRWRGGSTHCEPRPWRREPRARPRRRRGTSSGRWPSRRPSIAGQRCSSSSGRRCSSTIRRTRSGTWRRRAGWSAPRSRPSRWHLPWGKRTRL
jgi:hypothetical protein